jgi:serine/threonine protein kinase
VRDGDRVLICEPGKSFSFSHPVTIDLGAVTFRAWPPKRTPSQLRAYKIKARGFSAAILCAVPKPIPSIKSQPETATHNVRYGRNDAVYVNEGIESKGASATVMMVKDRTTGNIFGAKEPYYRTSDDPDVARERFETLRREYEAIMRLDHVSRCQSPISSANTLTTSQPHIMKAYDLVLAEDVTLPPWMIVEYIPQNLREILPQLDTAKALAVFTQLSSALRHLHERSITHRDVKPDNVLLKKHAYGFTVKLADFGTAKHTAAELMDTFTGTETYMAPELFAEPRHYTSKVDMWSLGLIGMQLFTAWDPSQDGNVNRNNSGPWIQSVIRPEIKNAPTEIRLILTGLLCENPKSRWSAQECLSSLLRADAHNDAKRDSIVCRRGHTSLGDDDLHEDYGTHGRTTSV